MERRALALNRPLATNRACPTNGTHPKASGGDLFSRLLHSHPVRAIQLFSSFNVDRL
jgi:hypothetical protein